MGLHRWYLPSDALSRRRKAPQNGATHRSRSTSRDKKKKKLSKRELKNIRFYFNKKHIFKMLFCNELSAFQKWRDMMIGSRKPHRQTTSEHMGVRTAVPREPRETAAAAAVSCARPRP